MEKFKIIDISNGCIHVIVLGTGNFVDFWVDLEIAIREMHISHTSVLLDMCLRHGLSNRFFSTTFHNMELQINEVISVIPSSKIQDLHDKFILHHKEILACGILAINRQKRILQLLKEKYS